MVLITNRDLPDSYRVTDVQDVTKLIEMKKHLNFLNSNIICIDSTVTESDRNILTKFFNGLGTEVKII